MHTIKIIQKTGSDIKPYLPELAKLRLKVFNDYPYLYEGDMENEKAYLKTYEACPHSLFIFVLNHKKIVGASTAIPLTFETDAVKKPFIEHNMHLDEIFYFGESVLLPSERGQGIYRQFFEAREAAATQYGCKIATFCAVERNNTDMRKPAQYKPLDDIWQHFGYQKHPELYTYFEWKEIGESQPSPKRLNFWIKNLL